MVGSGRVAQRVIGTYAELGDLMTATRCVTLAMAMLALLGVVTGAQATVLPAGSTVSLSNLDFFTGTVVADTGAVPYSFPGPNTGTVREWVVMDASSALCA